MELTCESCQPAGEVAGGSDCDGLTLAGEASGDALPEYEQRCLWGIRLVVIDFLVIFVYAYKMNDSHLSLKA